MEIYPTPSSGIYACTRADSPTRNTRGYIPLGTEEYYLLASSASFLIQPRPTCLEMVSTVGWPIRRQSLIKIISQTWPQADLIQAVLSTELLSSQETLGCTELTLETNQASKGCSSVAGHWPSMQKCLPSIPSTGGQKMKLG